VIAKDSAAERTDQGFTSSVGPTRRPRTRRGVPPTGFGSWSGNTWPSPARRWHTEPRCPGLPFA